MKPKRGENRDYILSRLAREAKGGDAIEILRREIPDYDARIQRERTAAVKPAAKHGGTGANQYTGEESKPDNVRSATPDPKPKGYGNSKDYIIGRLKRDSRLNGEASGRTNTRSIRAKLIISTLLVPVSQCQKG
ncbi:hypothetical protein [Thioalkalivibrio paradoxus]|uniref:hypothetical protein n=1 Tax=Thioalkalivibrio paradoxus TaxID=108010 RepID=UPI0012EC600F|nr:hypothetical protein [Thioalkalivibrio paradoxus]